MLPRIRHAGAPVRAMIVTAVAILAACGNPLDVVTTSRIPAEQVETPANAALLVDGAVADFECAFASYVVQSATVGEEFIYAQQTADRTPPDARRVTASDARYANFGCEGLGIYVPLQTARNSAEKVLGYLKGWTDAEVPTNRTNLIATAAAYAGYSYVLLGEGFCTMAFSKVNPDRTIEYGGEIQRDSVFKIAIARFTEAIAAAQTANNTAILRMAYMGRARARLSVADYAGAKADAQLVPAGFVRNATYTEAIGRRTNRVWADNALLNRSSSVGEPYRTIGDTLSATRDLRVPVVRSNPLFTTAATGVQHWYQLKYINGDAPIPIATYEEAQLIIAEADIRAGNFATALTIINASRERGNPTPAVPRPYTGPVTQVALLAELVEQRRRELFLESHHLGDIIRYSIAVTPATGTPYHFGGGTYQNQICFPLPASERQNNPLIGS
ncbi:MAG: RagB/SusD family nutrient uptake outer membrane protein [Gemmatimonadota bacterium]|nr:RagB/SusD family nutrient uptake outer membrane protein [Gemmatimonadota bacterium]